MNFVKKLKLSLKAKAILAFSSFVSFASLISGASAQTIDTTPITSFINDNMGLGLMLVLLIVLLVAAGAIIGMLRRIARGKM